MIILLGKTGFIGSQVLESVNQAGLKISGISRNDIDYYNYTELRNFLSEVNASF